MPVLFIFAALSTNALLDMDVFFQKAEQQTQKAISDAPRAIESLRKSSKDPSARVALYEKRVAELRDGKKIVSPLLPFPPEIGGIGALPSQLRILKIVDSQSMVIEGNWSAPQPDLIGRPSETARDNSAKKAKVYLKGISTQQFKERQVLSLPGVFVANGEEEMGGSTIRLIPIGVSDDRLVQMFKEWQSRRASSAK